MNLSNLIRMIYEELLHFMPLFRMVWIGSISLGVAMLVISLALKRNPERKKSPWIVGTVAMLMIISAGTQLIVSLL